MEWITRAEGNTNSSSSSRCIRSHVMALDSRLRRRSHLCHSFTAALRFDPGRTSAPSLHGALARFPPVRRRELQPRHSCFEAHSHGFSTGCLRFVPPLSGDDAKLASGGGQPFRVGFYYPLSYEREFWAFPPPAPLSGLVMARRTFLSAELWRLRGDRRTRMSALR